MKNKQDKFTKKQGYEKRKDQFGKEKFGKLVNRGIMRRWGKSKNMGRGKT